jgi:hypothetical protein
MRSLAVLSGLCALALALAACSSSDATGAAGPTPDDVGATLPDGAPAEPPAGDSGTSTSDEAAAPDGVRFKIQIDYRYDKAGFFADPIRKQALEGACRIWGRLIADKFANVPKGTYIRVRDPEKPTEPALALEIDYEIDDLLLFVGSSDLPAGVSGLSSPTAGLSGVTNEALRTSLSERFDGNPFQPWTAWISFDTTSPFHFDPTPELGSAVPAGKLDFVSVALHEIGHVLGFGTADAFKNQITGGTFTGPKASALYGGPVPLTPDRGHVPNTTMSGGHRMLMDQSDALGTRYLPTPLDRAVMEDLGLHF